MIFSDTESVNNRTVGNKKIRLFVFDMDSTLVDAETIDELAKAAGAAEEVAKITESAMRGETDFTASLERRVAFLKGLSVEDAKKAVSEMPLMTGAPELLEYIRSTGAKTAMITCGFSIAADRVGRQLNIDYVFSNELGEENGVLTGTAAGPLTTTGSKEKVFDGIIKETGTGYDECVVVGDGANDICLFRKAGFSIAFNAKPAVRAAACVSVTEKDLRGLIPVIEDLLKGVYDDVMTSTVHNGKTRKPSLCDGKGGPMEMMNDFESRKNELKTLSEEAKEKRNQLNAEASNYAAERNALNTKTKELIGVAQEYKGKRDEVNVNVSKYKELRDTTNAKANELFAQADTLRKGSNLDGPSIKQIRKQIDQLEFTQQTTVLTPKKEKELVTKVKELEKEYEEKKKQLEENTDLKVLLEEAQKIRDEASEYHVQLSEYAKAAQEFHEKMIAAFKEADKTRADSDVAHKNFVKAQEAADEQHNVFIQYQKEIREIDKELGIAPPPRTGTAPRKAKENKEPKIDRAEAEKDAKDIMDKFKDGGKLTMEDLMSLQRAKY